MDSEYRIHSKDEACGSGLHDVFMSATLFYLTRRIETDLLLAQSTRGYCLVIAYGGVRHEAHYRPQPTIRWQVEPLEYAPL